MKRNVRNIVLVVLIVVVVAIVIYYYAARPQLAPRASNFGMHLLDSNGNPFGDIEFIQVGDGWSCSFYPLIGEPSSYPATRVEGGFTCDPGNLDITVFWVTRGDQGYYWLQGSKSGWNKAEIWY